MSDKKLKKRDEIANEYKWDIEAMYPDENQWDKDLDWCLKESEKFLSYQGHVSESADKLFECIDTLYSIYRKLEHALVYAHMKKDEDNRVAKYIGMDDKAGMVAAKISANVSFFTPELLKADESTILGYINQNPKLKTYEFMLKDALREKSHILSKEEENILAQLGEVSDSSHDIFTMLNNAEMKFGKIIDEDGDEVELTHGN